MTMRWLARDLELELDLKFGDLLCEGEERWWVYDDGKLYASVVELSDGGYRAYVSIELPNGAKGYEQEGVVTHADYEEALNAAYQQALEVVQLNCEKLGLHVA